MSSALSSLKGTKRAPLPPLGRNKTSRDVRATSSLDSLDMRSVRNPSVLDSATQKSIVDELRRSSSRGSMTNLPSVQKKNGTKPCRSSADSDLVTSMASRLTMVERELLSAKRELLEKDQRIAHLQEKVKLLERSMQHGETESQTVRDLKSKCLGYQKQIEEMEEFLSDYGMIWVGQESGEVAKSSKSSSDDQPLWKPGESLAEDVPVEINFEAIVKNIKDLNVLAGEGELRIASSGQEAALKAQDPVPLALYKNGFAMFSGPFRPYSDPFNHQFIQDLTDGYFPSELRDRYPRGVPFLVKDLREKLYIRSSSLAFDGCGHRLGGVVGSSRLLPPSTTERHLKLKKTFQQENTTSELPVKPISVDSFLQKLPSNVVRDGRLISVRQDIQHTLTTSSKASESDTAAPPSISSHSPLTSSSSCEEVCILRVKSEDGSNVFVVKMSYSSTVGELKQKLNQMRPTSVCKDYILRCNYPKRMLSEDDTTLYQVGLFSSANLFIEPKTR